MSASVGLDGLVVVVVVGMEALSANDSNVISLS